MISKSIAAHAVYQRRAWAALVMLLGLLLAPMHAFGVEKNLPCDAVHSSCAAQHKLGGAGELIVHAWCTNPQFSNEEHSKLSCNEESGNPNKVYCDASTYGDGHWDCHCYNKTPDIYGFNYEIHCGSPVK